MTRHSNTSSTHEGSSRAAGLPAYHTDLSEYHEVSHDLQFYHLTGFTDQLTLTQADLAS